MSAHLPGDLLGCFLPEERTIYLDARLTPIERRSVLAHELGHVRHGHPRTGRRSAQDVASEERQADRFAAFLLVDPEAYARLERIDPDPATIADELGVTRDIVDTFRTQCVTRLADASYAFPRMGRGQWSYRSAPFDPSDPTWRAEPEEPPDGSDAPDRPLPRRSPR